MKQGLRIPRIRPFPALILPLIAAMIVPYPAAAAREDGGVRSVFAAGAGNRALALGGAYTALTGEAGVLFWNPGGLALLERAEFQAAYASLYGLDISEQHAALVLPSWRWGVTALGFRQLGVGGLDRRDDRNVLLEDDLSSSDLEISLGYGKTLGEAWSLGGRCLLRRQQVMGLSGSGLGADIGLSLAPAAAMGKGPNWLRPLRLGLAVQNLIEPTIKLDRESVGDPATVRLGIGFETSLPRAVRLLAALDLERPSSLAARPHAGLELGYGPLALRGGLSRDRLTAGAGVVWRGLRFDYAFEDNPIEPLHRFGMSLGFGATTHERRQALLRAEEAALQAKLASAYEERQAQRIRELMDQAADEVAGGRQEQALETLAMLRALTPENPEADSLAVLCHVGTGARLEQSGELAGAAVAYSRALALRPADALAQASLARCRAESDRRAARSTELRQRFAEALDAFAAGKLTEARQSFLAILALQPDDGEAASMLTRTEQLVQQRVRSLLEQVGASIENGRFADAGRLLDEAGQLAPEHAELAVQRSRLAAAQAAHERESADESGARARASRPIDPAAAGASVPAARPALTAKERAEIADLYRRGLAAADAGKSDDALRYWELVWSAQPGYQGVDDYLKREYLMRGMEQFTAGRLEEATRYWEKALQVDPRDERTLGYLARAREQLMRSREIMNE